jgi:integrase
VLLRGTRATPADPRVAAASWPERRWRIGDIAWLVASLPCRADLRRSAAAAGVRRAFAPHRLRHAHAVEMAREGVPPIVVQRQLGHSNLGITSVYLQGIDSGEIIETVHARRAPMLPVSASLRM